MSKIRKKNVVSQANSLIEARYTITKNEQLLLFAMISLINPNDEKFLTFTVEVEQIIEILELDKKSGLREFEKIVHRLMTRVIKINTPTGWELFHWVSSAKLKNNLISLRFHDDLKPYLLELKKSGNFTQQRLGMAIHFHSIYTIRIYQLLKEYKSKKMYYFEFSLDEFRKMVLGDKSNAYPLYKNFRNKVIDRAKVELGNKDKKTNLYISDLNFDLETRRTGRFISHLKFFVITQETTSKESDKNILKENSPTIRDGINSPIIESQKPLEIKQPQQELNKPSISTKNRKITPEIETMRLLGITENKAFELLNKHGVKYIKDKLAVLGEMQEIRSIKSPSGFFLKAINDDYQSETLIKKSKEKEARKISIQKEQEKKLEDYRHNITVHFEREIKKQFLSQLNQAQKENLWAEIKPLIKYNIPSSLIQQGKELESPVVGVELNKNIPNYEERKTNYIHKKMMEKRAELFGNIDDF